MKAYVLKNSNDEYRAIISYDNCECDFYKTDDIREANVFLDMEDANFVITDESDEDWRIVVIDMVEV